MDQILLDSELSVFSFTNVFLLILKETFCTCSCTEWQVPEIDNASAILL